MGVRPPVSAARSQTGGDVTAAHLSAPVSGFLVSLCSDASVVTHAAGAAPWPQTHSPDFEVPTPGRPRHFWYVDAFEFVFVWFVGRWKEAWSEGDAPGGGSVAEPLYVSRYRNVQPPR